ncbi:MAG: VOC family protein [Kiritimatiellaeota bacterium]|nr:VOC family protein [Kiritimatiellota bacterium]
MSNTVKNHSPVGAARNHIHGVVVKIENMKVSRSFYRDVLNLGPPIMDSNFWVEFKLDSCSSLILEQVAPGEKLSVSRGRIAWLCETSEFDASVETLARNGFEPISDESERVGVKTRLYSDPEGNPFYICEPRPVK